MDKGYTTLCLFRKDDVIDFFKNGKAFLHCPVLSETMTVEEIAEDAKNCDKLFDKANPIDYSIYYFILQFVSDKKKDKSAMVEIEELRGIFPLDNESYRIGLHLSPEIRLEKPIFQQAFYNFQKSKLLESSRSGVENIARIFDIEIKLPKKFNKKDQEALVDAFYSGTPINGEHSIWYYLLGYSRRLPYPKDNRGLFIDILHIFYNFTTKAEINKDLSQSNAGQAIMGSNYTSYKELLGILSNQINFIKQSQKKADKYYWRIAPLYLCLRLYVERNNGLITKEMVESIKKNYEKEDLKYALALLGFTLGQDNTYKSVYINSNLPFLQKD